jgi:hypothetical protein
MYYDEFLPKIRAALTEATQVVASGRLRLPFTATYKPSQIKEAIVEKIEEYRHSKLLRTYGQVNTRPI